MLQGRFFEDKLAALYRAGKVVGGVYLGRGQEAFSVALAMHLEREKGDVYAPLIRDQAGRTAFGEPMLAAARTYHENGAAAISCLTDEKYFQGKLEYIAQIKKAIPLPVLRKDFIIDPYQIYEARAAGADAVLLIAECLGEAQMIDLLILATELKLTALVEVHDYESLIQVKSHVGFPHPGYQLLGINNRNLKTMTTDVGHTLELLKEVPSTDILVSESGIRTHDDIQRLAEADVHRVLVGEHLMRQGDIGLALRELMGNA